MPTSSAAIERTERWFIERGVPHFIAGYSASRDVFTRTLPILTAIFLLEMLGVLNLEWEPWMNVLAAAGGLAFLVGVWVLANLLRHRRPLSRPEQVGRTELAVFVLAPAVLPLVTDPEQWQSAVTTALANLSLLGIIYLGTSYGLVPMTRWAAIYLARQLGALANLLVRSLPLLLLFVTFLFVNTEVWQVAAHLYGPTLPATLGLFVLVGVLFVVMRLPREVGQLVSFDSWQRVVELTRGTPAEELSSDAGDASAVRLSRRQWGNVSLVVLVATGVQVVLVSLMIGGFFVLFGMLAIRPDVIESWLASEPHVIATVTLGGTAYRLTEELLRVSSFLAAFSGLYFTVYVLTDAAYRTEFFEEVVGEVRVALAARVVYLAAVDEAAAQ